MRMQSMLEPFKDRYGKFIVAAIVFICLLRLFFIGEMGMMPQDAYYSFYSDHLALSYFDHPPAIAYILRLSMTIFGRHVFVLKLADTVVTLLTIVSFYKLASLFLDKEKVQTAMILLLSTFMVTILSLISTPDVPLLLFWTLSLLALYNAIFREKKYYWLWSGICMGLTFDSKYTAVFLPAGVFLFLILSPVHRKQLLSPWLWIGAVLFVLTISPVIIWNVQHDFASFRFQSEERMSDPETSRINIVYFFGLIGHQAAILMPVLLTAFFILLYKTFKQYKLRIASIPAEELFLLCFFLPLFGGFILISFVYWIKLNWIMPAYITGIIWVTKFFNKKWLKVQVVFALVLHMVLALEVIFYLVPVNSNDTWVGWKQFAQKVKTVRSAYPRDFIFSADGYKTSAVLNFYMDEMVYSSNIVGQEGLQFDFVNNDFDALKGKNALFFRSDPRFKNLGKANDQPGFLLQYFDGVKELDPIIITDKNGKAIRKFLVYECMNYKPGKK
ncbi:glycosyltransferase family 39 protein [Chitinophagaceae bacterium 26-R-25]|nr:glycosyltransferase family 39 protein [Chitinophagaceae bacterium 26-R-25]